MIWRTLRKSRKHRRCDVCCHSWIYPGDEYVSSVASPWHYDLGNGFWWRLTVCSRCAKLLQSDRA